MENEKKKLYISFNYNLTSHDWSVSLNDNIWMRIVSIQLERLDRYKYSPFDTKNIDLQEIWEIFFEYIEEATNVKIYEEIYILNSPVLYKTNSKVIYTYNNNHHFLHAASVFFLSWYEKSLIIWLDASWYDNNLWESIQTIWEGKWKEIRLLKSTPDTHWYGIGIAYYVFSTYLWIPEWSVMWLAAYWNYDKYSDIDIFKCNDGEVILSQNFQRLFEIDVKHIDSFFIRDCTKVLTSNILFKKITSYFNKTFWVTNEDIKLWPNTIHADIAAKIQHEVEEAVLYLCRYYGKNAEYDNLCFVGWVALNSVLNWLIAEKWYFKNIFIPPCADDAGLSLWWLFTINANKIKFPQTSFGRNYGDEEVKRSIDKYKWFLSCHKISINKLVDILMLWKIIWVFHGGSEFGARALWYRSILAHPSFPEIKDKLNVLKKRSWWRPLGMIFKEEDICKYIEYAQVSSPYMNFVWKVRKNYREDLVSGLHIDMTTRYQTVNNSNNTFIYQLLNEIQKDDLVQAVINTSFNVSGEPIVEDPEQAIRAFLSTSLDYLYIEWYLLSKEKIYKEMSFVFDSISHNKQKASLYKNNWIKIAKILFWEDINFIFMENDEKHYTYNIMYKNIALTLIIFSRDGDMKFILKNDDNVLCKDTNQIMAQNRVKDIIKKRLYKIQNIYGSQINEMIIEGVFYKRLVF